MKKLLIIGGGIAGLSAGIHAQMAGFASEIYEKNPVAGGQCMGWDRKNHHIDNCIHWLTGTKKGTSLYTVWENMNALGDDIKMVKHTKFYTSTLDGVNATLWKDLDRTQKELLQIAPEDAKEIHRFITQVKRTECCEMPAEKPMDMLNLANYISMGTKMAGMGKMLKEYGKLSIEDLANRFKNPLLRKLITDSMPKGYLATALIFSYATITSGNGNIPLKGSLAMVNRIIQRYKELGGTLHTNTPVKKITLNQTKADNIILADDTKIPADYIICATDTAETFKNLLPSSYMSEDLQKCYDNRAAYPVFSGFQMAYSIDTEIVEAGVTFFNCTPFEVAGKTIDRMGINSFSYDPHFAPHGKTVLQVNILQQEDDFAYWKSLDAQRYQTEKQAIAQAVAQNIIEQYPTLKSSISLLDIWTPLSYERYCNSYKGAYMAFNTIKNVKTYRIKESIKGLSNVFLASQWLQYPGGLPTAATSGKFAIQRILKQEGLSYKL